VLTRLTTLGALYLALVCLLPELLLSNFAVPFYFGGTSLLIVVSVTMDTVGQIHSHLLANQYEGLAEEAKRSGLAVVVWSYPRGSGVSREGETAIDVAAYAAQIAAQLGAHLIKVKPPTAHIEQDAARKVYEAQGIPIESLADRVRHVVQSAFNGRRIVIFSGGAAKGREAVLEEIQGIADGGGFGSIVGRNAFQRTKTEAIELLHEIMGIYEKV